MIYFFRLRFYYNKVAEGFAKYNNERMKGVINMTQQMKAVGLYKSLPTTDLHSLVDLMIDQPTPEKNDLLVAVQAVSVNPIDTKLRMRQPSSEIHTPKILGFDVAGIVEEVGTEVTDFQPGDPVFYAGSLTRSGGNSQFHLVDQRIASKMPTSLSFTKAAALPLTALTACEALFDRLHLPLNAAENRGKTIMLIGAAGGVGSIAIQLAKLAGLTVIATASRESSQAWCTEMGADHVVNHHQPLQAQLETHGFSYIDSIFSLYRTDAYWEQIADIIAPQGKVCAIMDHMSPVDLNQLKSKSITFVWESMFTRPIFQTQDLAKQGEWLKQLAAWVDQGYIRTTMQEELHPINAKNLRKAHQQIESGKTVGKIVLSRFEE